ncbi:MAG: hypothetical protein ACOYOB_14140 [Myxococcota bacterium]
MRHPGFPLAATCLAWLATGCGPSLTHQTHLERNWKADVACAQGPLEFSTEAAGARWGEHVVVKAESPRALQGRYEWVINGAVVSQGQFVTQKRVAMSSSMSEPNYQWQQDERADNARCIARPTATAADTIVESVQAPVPPPIPARPPAAAPGWVPAPPGWTPPPPMALPPPLPAPEPVPAPAARPTAPEPEPDPHRPLLLPDQPSNETLLHQATVLDWSQEWRDPEVFQGLAKGVAMVLRVWFPEPNDLEGARFRLVHEVAVPDVPEAEWLAFLRKEKAEQERDAAEWLEENRRERAKREQHCSTHLNDEDCWGKGGYEGLRRRQAEADARRRREDEARAKAPPVVVPVAAAEPQPHDPTEPPPAPEADPRPTRPSSHAEWVAGWWHWSGFAHVWLTGWWRIPDEDRQVAVAAPDPPPPPAPELVPAPMPGVVWVPGGWWWNGLLWVWVHGGWWRVGR